MLNLPTPSTIKWVKKFPYLRLSNEHRRVDFNHIPIVPDHPSSTLAIQEAIESNILERQQQYLQQNLHLIILDYIECDAVSGQIIATARDPARIRLPKTVFVETSKVTFGIPCLARFKDEKTIVEVQNLQLSYPELDTNIKAIIDMLYDRGIGVHVSENANNVFVPLLFSYVQNHGPYEKIAGLRCAVSLSAYDGVSAMYEELESVARLLSPNDSFSRYGEIEEHTVVTPSQIQNIPEKVKNALSAYRGTFGILSQNKELFQKNIFAEHFTVNALDVPRNAAKIMQKDDVMLGAARALSLVLSYMPVEYKENNFAETSAQKAGLMLAHTKISKSLKHNVGGEKRFRFSED